MSKNTYEELVRLVDEAIQLIKNEGEFFTEGSKIAIIDQVDRARAVIKGNYSVPFVRNREFYKPREDEAVLFIKEHYSRAPSYFMNKYGLKPALEWFKSQHIMNEDKKSLLEKKAFVIEKASDFINSIKFDGRVGSYSEDAVLILKKELQGLYGIEDKALGKAIVNVYDALRKVRHTRVLLSDIEKQSTLYFSKNELEEFKKHVVNDKFLKAQYEKIKEIADSNTPEDIEHSKLFMQIDIDYKEVNKYFYVWSTTDRVINFTSPKNASYAKIKFVLPCCENEQEGLGHVWIDNVRVFPAKGVDWNVLNCGFEEGRELPDFWNPISVKGNPVLKWEDRKTYCGSESHSIYLQNATNADEGSWEYAEDIPIEGDVNNTITFFAKIDGKLKEGIKVVIEFKDEKHNKIDEFVEFFNRKSCFTTANYNLTIQADAIVYAFTGDVSYARKVKQQLLFILNDFCQGIEHWMVLDSRPQGSDAYGAVQGGRIMCSIMSAYTLVKEAGVFTKKDVGVIMPQLEYFVRYLMDLRDRTELSEYEVQADATNWQTDMAAGTGMLMMAMPDFPNARQWLENANILLRSQLKENVNEDGSWPESIRYHFAALSRFLIYSKALLNCTGKNWFKDGPLVQMFRYAIMMQTPPYEYFENQISTVNFGDHTLNSSKSFLLAGIYCNDILEFDEELAALMHESWIKAGKPSGCYGGESVAIENLFSAGESFTNNKGCKLDLKSCGEFKDSGIYLFRKDYGKPTESLFAIMASPHKIGHGHYDEGSFMLFKACKPIVADLGIEGYFDSTKDWYVSSSSHNVVQFSREDGRAAPQAFTINLEVSDYSAQAGWVDTPRQCEVLDFTSTEEMDSIAIKINNTEGEGYHIRKVNYYRYAEVYVISDKVYSFSRKVRFNLNVAAVESVVEGNRVFSRGHFGIDLETVFLGNKPQITIELGRTYPMFPAVNGKNAVNIIRAESDGSNGFLTALYPKYAGQGRLDISSSEGRHIIITPDGKKVIF